MSGPKNMYIETDPWAIEQINAEIDEIGTAEYYKNQVYATNSDLRNTIEWIYQYAVISTNKLKGTESYKSTLEKIALIKQQYSQLIENEIIQDNLVYQLGKYQLNELVMGKINFIPNIKGRFEGSISKALNELDELLRMEEEKKRIGLEKQKKREEEEKKRAFEDGIKSSQRAKKTNLNDIVFSSNKINLDQVSFELEFKDIVQVEELLNKIEECLACKSIIISEKKSLEQSKKQLENIVVDTDISLNEKRKIIKYNKECLFILNEFINKKIVNEIISNKERELLIYEFKALCEVLRIDCGLERLDNIGLQDMINQLKSKLRDKMELDFIEHNLNEVMAGCGFDICSSSKLDENKTLAQNIFTINENTAVNTYTDSEMIMLEVVAIGNNEELTTKEVDQTLKEMRKFCELYPRIKEELKKRGVNINSESVVPPQKEVVKKMKLSDVLKANKKSMFIENHNDDKINNTSKISRSE